MTVRELADFLTMLPPEADVVFAQCDHCHLLIDKPHYVKGLGLRLVVHGWTDDCNCETPYCSVCEAELKPVDLALDGPGDVCLCCALDICSDPDCDGYCPSDAHA